MKAGAITLIGTRPEVIKMSPLIPVFDREFDHFLVHSGQHYSTNMDRIFFDDLSLRLPDVNLEVGSGSPGAQVARILEGFEQIVIDRSPDFVVVQGDTNTALAGALAAAKHRDKGVRLVHIEAGMRSFLEMQPEELNRKLIDQMSDVLCVPAARDRDNALAEGIDPSRIDVCGNTVIESCLRARELADAPSVLKRLGLTSGDFVLATFHRQETVDAQGTLRTVCEQVRDLALRVPVVVPVHPRTRKMLDRYGLSLGDRVVETEPLAYTQMIALLSASRFVVTDSGGLQEEAAVLGKRAAVLRDRTEHTAYVDCGMHLLVGTDEERIRDAFRRLLDGEGEADPRCVPRPGDDLPSALVVRAMVKRQNARGTGEADGAR